MKAAILSLIAAAVAAAQSVPADRLMNAYQDRILSQGTVSLKTDDRISMYETLAKAQPGNAHYQNLLAGAFIQKVRESMDFSYLDRASNILSDVLASDGKNYEALRLRTEIALERHDFKTAAEYSKSLVDWAPNDAWNWGTLGDAYIELGEYEAAGDAYQRMINIHPDLSSYNRASYFRFLRGDVEGAVKIMKMAIAAGSATAENTAWCAVELGNMYLKTGNLAEAESAFRQALRYFPNYHPGLAGLAKSRAAQKDWKGAIENMKQALASTPFPDYAAALYDFYTASGNSAEAERQKELIAVIERLGQAGKETANRNLALIYADHDWNLDRALEYTQNELKVRGDVYTYDALGWALFKNHRYDEAWRSAQKALQFKTPEPGFYYHAGLIANACGRKAEARELLKRALELNPNFDVRQASIAGRTLQEIS